MESKFLLTFKEKKLQRIYDKFRNKEIQTMNIVSLLFRILFIASNVLKNEMRRIPIDMNIMIATAIVFGIQIVFSIGTWKKPAIFAKHSAPAFLLFQTTYAYFIPIYNESQFTVFMFAQSFYLVFGILCSHTWFYTSIFLIINGVGSVSIIIGKNGIYELSTMVMNVTALGLLIFVSYRQEMSLKNQVLQFHQIQHMNEELSILFNNLPEGIALYDPITMKVSLMNEEFKRLFNLQDSEKKNKDLNLIQQTNKNNSFKIEDICSARDPFVEIEQIDNSDQSLNIGNDTKQEILQAQLKINESSIFIEDETQDQFEKFLYVPRLQLFKYGQQIEKEDNIQQSEDEQKYNILEASKIQRNDGSQKYFKILPDLGLKSQNKQQPEYLTIQESNLSFKNQAHNMILTKNITTMINYENIKVENYFYEMLTATVSHDMRTPLNAIQGLLKNLELFIIDPRGKKFLKIIQNSSSFLTFLVNDLLDFFQIKNGKFRTNNSTVDLKTTFQNLVEMFSVGANEKGLQVLFSPQTDFPKQIIIDEQRTKQILLNLLQNALKFTFKGSIHIFLTYEKEQQQIRVSVADTGVGIKIEDQEKLFKIFGKLEQTSNINTQGIGLGLGICKNLVEMLGGKILIESDYQNGAKFTFTIKCEAIQDEQDSCSNQYSEEDSQSLNQLIRMNEQQFQMIQTKQLSSSLKQKSKIRTTTINQQSSKYLGGENLRSQYTEILEGDHEIDIKEFYNHKSIINNQNNIQSNLSQNNHYNIEKQNIQENNIMMIETDEVKVNMDSINDDEFSERKHQNYDIDKDQEVSTNLNCLCEKKSKILVVDDNVFNLVTIQSILELKFGLQSDRATHGLEAFELFKQRITDDQNCCDNLNCPIRLNKGYKLILMDCNMPIMDGFQSTMEIRKFEDSLFEIKSSLQEKATIIALTAYTADLFKQKCFEVGMDDYLTKPVSADQIEKVLQLSRLIV
eukprot:403353254